MPGPSARAGQVRYKPAIFRPQPGAPRRRGRQSEGNAGEALIFISIAAYRDPELGATVEDCLAKARFPNRLRFGVCWQHDEADPAPRCFTDSRVQVVRVGWRESQGACWARAQIMSLWNGEDWYLQLDSHHRFVKAWDVKLLQQAERSGSAKPVITTYAPSYTPGGTDDFAREPSRMEFDRFTEDGIPGFHPGHFANWKDRTGPARGRYASAHFLLAPGSFVRDVPYDPELYFTGEEITMAVRAFTHGYDLFEPSRVILVHEYTREGRRKHWDDHLAGNGEQPAWFERDGSSRVKVQRLLREPWVGADGLGQERTMADYEAYAGIDFRRRRIHDHARLNFEPPTPTAAGWAEATAIRRVQILLAPSLLPPAAIDEAQFWYVGFHTASGMELYRQDADARELATVFANLPGAIALTRTFVSTAEPATWTVIPYTKGGGWLQAISGPIARDHVALGERIDSQNPPA